MDQEKNIVTRSSLQIGPFLIGIGQTNKLPSMHWDPSTSDLPAVVCCHEVLPACQAHLIWVRVWFGPVTPRIRIVHTSRVDPPHHEIESFKFYAQVIFHENDDHHLFSSACASGVASALDNTAISIRFEALKSVAGKNL